jgi:hypothetical protein
MYTDESLCLPSTTPLPHKPGGEESLGDSIGHAADELHHLVEEENDDNEDDDGGESDLSQPSDLPSSQPSDPVAIRRQTSAKRKFLKRVESDPTLPDSQPLSGNPRVDEEEEEQSEAVKRNDAEPIVDAERSIGTTSTTTTTATTATTATSKSKAKAKSEGEDEQGKKKRSRSKRESETKEERIKKHKESEARKKQFIDNILGKVEAQTRKPKQVLTPLVPLTEQARQLLDRCEEQQSQRLSQQRSGMVARTQRGREGSDNENDYDETSEDELQPTQGIYDLADVLTRCRQFKSTCQCAHQPRFLQLISIVCVVCMCVRVVCGCVFWSLQRIWWCCLCLTGSQVRSWRSCASSSESRPTTSSKRIRYGSAH